MPTATESLTAAVTFEPRRMQSTTLTTAAVRAELKAIGLRLIVGADGFFVCKPGEKRDDGYPTDDLGDALETGRAIATTI